MQLDDIKGIQSRMPGAVQHPGYHPATQNHDDPVSDSTSLRSISIKNPTYQKDDLNSEGNLFDQAMRDQESASSAGELKNRMVLSAEDMTDEEYAAMEKDDHSPMDMEEDEYVTIADKIRAQLEKGGADIAMTKAAQLSDLSEPGMLYLLKNDMPPTIDNVFEAEFSGGSGKGIATNIKRSDIYVDVQANKPERVDLFAPEMESMLGQVKGLIEEAGLEITDDTITEAGELIANDIPLTTENIDYFNRLNHEKLRLTPDEVASAVSDSIAEGKSAGDAYLLEGYSLHDRARELYDRVQNMTADPSDVTAERKLGEIRLMMTVEASYTMLRSGIEVDTFDLSRLVDELRLVEEKLSLTEKQDKAIATIDEVKEAPAAILGGFYERIDTVSISMLYEASAKAAAEMTSQKKDGIAEANAFTLQYEKAAGRYETMATEVRRDLGDSIKKAFSNIDDILKDLGMDETSANERAVRILGYNSMEISAESVTTMKYADQRVKSTLSALTPGVVTELIKRGENPLDMSLEKLDKTIAEISEQVPAASTFEKFSEFLWKLDHTCGMSQEQRESFIGVYRLIHQVEKTDGAVIGQLMSAGMEPTLRNMMTAIRSVKNRGKSYTVDDDFGGIKAVDVGKLSITEQIEAGFMYSRLQDAGNEMTPNLMMNFESEDSYMNMNPDQFATALEQMDDSEDVKQQKLYATEQLERLKQAVAAEERVYQILSDMDAPTTPANLEAWSMYMADKNNAFRSLNRAMYKRESKAFSQITDELDIDDPESALSGVMADIVEAFGEAAKTPEEMAEAQEELARTAESVMRDMIVERETGHIDVRGMRITMKQLSLLGRAARDTEQYAIPIMVADELGNMTLKIVRGEDEKKGQVQVSLDMESIGSVSANFRLNGDALDGNIRVSSPATRDLISENMRALGDRLSGAAEIPVGLSVGLDETIDSNSIYSDKADFETTSQRREIQTRKLYAVARAFIQGFGEII